MAKKSIGIWGVDVGQCALKALRLEIIDGKPTATAFDYIEHPKILSQPDADPDALTREALEKFLSRNPLGKDEVAMSTPGQSGLARFVKLPPVEEKKVAEIVKFEAKQQIPFPLEEVVWDFQKISGGEAVGGFAMETEIGLFAMKRELISKYLGHFQSVGAEVTTIQMAPLALTNFATYELLRRGGPDGVEGDAMPGEEEAPRGKKRCVVVLDIGTDSSNLIITDAGRIIWQRPIPLGGNHFTRALTKEMKLTFAKAEHLKRNAAKSPDLATILRSLRPVLTEFVGEVQRSLGFFTNTHRDAHVSYLVGLGNAFRLPGLQKYLSEKLALDVRKPSRFDRLSGESVLADPTFNENLLSFPIAYGLAIQGLGLARLQTNLLPAEVRTDRLIRAKKPAVAAAAAMLLLGVGVIGFGYGLQLQAATDPNIESAMKTADSAKSAATSQQSEVTTKQGEVEATQGQLKEIIIGGDERLNWIRLNEVIVAALPRHGDGSAAYPNGNLTEPEQRRFWDFQDKDGSGAEAYAKYKERISQGVTMEKMLYDDDKAQYLATVNVEVIYPRYVAELGKFLTTSHKAALTQFGRNYANDMLEGERELSEDGKTLKPKAIEGGGWVIEIRGYTYHKEGPEFLKKCLLRNLQKINLFAANTPGIKEVPKILPGIPDPINGNLKYPILWGYYEDDNPAPNSFKLIGQSFVDLFMKPATTMGGAGGYGGGPPGMPGSPSEVPPGGGGETFGSPEGGGDAMSSGMPGGAPLSAAQWTPRWVSGFSGSSSAFGAMGAGAGYPPAPGVGPQPIGGTTGPRFGPKSKKRYEFVAFIIWNEPTPTDKTTDAATSTGEGDSSFSGSPSGEMPPM